MIQLKIGNIDTQEYMTDYKIDISPVTEDSFENWDGTTVSKVKARKITISAKFENMPNSIASALASGVHQTDIEAEYTTPAPSEAVFSLKKYNCECEYPDYDDESYSADRVTWNIDITMEATEPVEDNSGGYL